MVGSDMRNAVNANITVSPRDHQFTAYNWQTPVTFTVTANSDDNLTNGGATIKHVAYIYDKDQNLSADSPVSLADVTVTETDVPRCPTTNIATDADTYRVTGQTWEWEWGEALDNWGEKESCASQNHALQPARYYQFSIPDNTNARNVTITLEADDPDPKLYLRQGDQRNGRQLAYNDDYQSNPGRPGDRWISRIRQNLGPGDYMIEAVYQLTATQGSYMPAFTLTVDGLNDDTDTAPECDVGDVIGSAVGGWDGSCDTTFTDGYNQTGTSNARWYKFQVTERGLYTITLKSDSADAYLHLRSGDNAKSGAYLARDNDDDARWYVSENHARIQRWLDPGWHTVEATTYHGGQTGPFTLNAKETRLRPSSAPTATGATLALSGWNAGTGHTVDQDGSWHYQADTGPDASCSAAQSGTALNLAGLSANTTYIYTAYKDANCADAIASTAFVTLAENVGTAPAVILTDANANIISSLSVPEEGSATYQVRLTAAPSDDVTVIIAEGATSPNNDMDITVTSPSGKSLTFSASNWWLPQTVMLSAADDADKLSGSRAINHTASGGGYDSVANATLTATEVENDAGIILSPADRIDVPEGGTATYTVKLSTQPSADVTISISRATDDGSDEDITVTGPTSLTFTPSNWNITRTVTLAAAQDDDVNEWVATIKHVAASTDADYNGKTANLIAKEDEDDVGIVLNPAYRIDVPEGGTATYTVKLSEAPTANVTVTIGRDEDTSHRDITIKDTDDSTTGDQTTPIVFTPDNWNTARTVTLAAAQDDDLYEWSATITHTAASGDANYTGKTANLHAVEDEDDQGIAVWPRFSWPDLDVPENGTGTYRVRLSMEPTGNVTVTISAGTGDTDITIKDTDDSQSGDQTGTITFTPDNYSTPREVILAAADDADLFYGALHGTSSRTINHSASGGGYDGYTQTITANEVEDDKGVFLWDWNAGAEVTSLTIPETGLARYYAHVSMEPTSNVTVTMAEGAGDTDIKVWSPSDKTRTITPKNWQYGRNVYLHADADTDSINGSRVITHTASGSGYDGVPAASLTATESDSNARLTASNVKGKTATLTLTERAGHTGAWHYRKNFTSVPDTCASVASGDSADVSGLNPRSGYLYGAYSDSSCNTPLAFAFFSRATLTGAATGADTATLTLTRWDPTTDGNWWYKHDGTGATCSTGTGETTQTANVTGLTAETEYTFSAYSDSGCTNTNRIATAREFTTQATSNNQQEQQQQQQQESAQQQSAPGDVGSVSASRESGGIAASWNAVDGATKYHVTYTTDGGASWSLAAGEHNTNSITIANADDSLAYKVGVRAGNDVGWSGWVNSNTVEAVPQQPTPEPEPTPTPPGNVGSVSASRENGGIKATWNAVDGATKYHVTYTTDGGSSWSLAAGEHDTNSITIANADDGLAYKVGVRAGNSAGWSGWVNSNTVPVVVSPPGNVASVSATHNGGSLSVSWQAASGADDYHVTYSGDGGASWELAAKAHTGTSMTISGIDSAKTYIVGVRSHNSAGYGGWVNSAPAAP